MIIFGINSVSEALSSDTTVEKIHIAKGNFSDRINRIVAEARKKNIKIFFDDKARLDTLSGGAKHQDVVAETTEFTYTPLEELIAGREKSGRPSLIIILDGVEDPHNLGAVIRVADCCGADGVVVPKHRGATVSDTVVKVSAGASAHVAVSKVTNINDAIRDIKDAGITVLAADMDGDSIYKTDLTGDVAIIIGGEGSGVHSLTKKLADGVISMPQFGKVNSLNASVATGVVMYEAVRQRLAKLDK